MAVKGQFSKKVVTEKILEVFKDSFVYNDGKEIRIPIIENGERVEIKVTLTCAKTNVGGADLAVSVANPESMQEETSIAAPTDEEKKKVSDLLNKLGL